MKYYALMSVILAAGMIWENSAIPGNANYHFTMDMS